MKHLGLSLLVAGMLAACGGGGGADATTSSGTEGAPAQTVAADPAASGASAAQTGTASHSTTNEPVSLENSGAGSASGNSPTGASTMSGVTYVGHWMGYQIVSTPTRYEDYLNGGGVLLKFANEGYGKLQAEGAMDVVAHWSGAPDSTSARLGVGFVGNHYSDQNVYGWGTGSHLMAAMVSGRFDPSAKRLSLTSAMAGGGMGATCKYCDGDYFTGTQNRIQLSPVGASSPNGFRLALAGNALGWSAVPGVRHWMVSVFEEGMSWGRTQEVYEVTLPFATTSPSPINGPAGRPQVYSVDEFLDMMLLKGGTLKKALPALKKGSRYVATITGFGVQPPDVVPSAMAWSSLRFSAP